MDNILFIGNGFDLHNGMKTSYNDYLDSINIPTSYIDDIITLAHIKNFFYLLKDVIIKFDYSEPSFIDTSYTLIEKSKNIIIFKLSEKEKFSNRKKLLNRIEKIFSESQKKINLYSHLSFDVFDDEIKFYILHTISDCISDGSIFGKDLYALKPLVTLEGELFNNLLYEYDNYGTINFNSVLGINFEVFKGSLSTYCRNFTFFELYLELIRKQTESNIDYFHIDEINTNGNWIDIENILYHNQFIRFQSKITNSENSFSPKEENIFMYRNFIKLFDGDTSINTDFECFKNKFSKYINNQQKIIEDNKTSVDKLLTNINNEFKLNKVYNFNYSNYTNAIFKEIDKNILIDNIHGSVDDGKNIVFGSNHYLFLNDLTSYNELLTKHNKEEYISQKESHYKLTKFYQVLKLSQIRKTRRLYHVNSLTILGHSIGNQDFEYFHTIINSNPQEIKLNIIWSSFEDKEGNPVNNLEPLTDAVYEMLESYKDLYQDITVHRMILENRIKFIHLDDFIEESTK